MTNSKVLTFFMLLIFLLNQSAYSQGNIPVGSWKTHFSYFQVNEIEETPEYIYASSENGLFRVNHSSGLSEAIGKTQGLSDTRISVLKFHKALSTLIIGYENGNIDLIDPQGFIINVDDIFRSASIVGSKRINHIFIYDDFAFLSCSFGLVKLDIRKIEVAEDYRNLGLGNVSQIEVFSSTIDQGGDSIYISTSQGIMQAPFQNNVNLQDVNNWRLFGNSDSLPTNNFGEIVSLGNSVFAARNLTDSTTFWQYKNGNWISRNPNLGQRIRRLKINNGNMILITADDIQIWQSEDSFNNIISNPSLFPVPNEFLLDESGSYWIASSNRGLLSNIKGSFDYYQPNGPFKDLVARLAYNDGRIIVTSGGRKTNFTQQLNAFGFSSYEDGEWTNSVPQNLPNTNPIGIFLRDLYEPYYYQAGGFWALGSIGYGVLMQYDEDSFQIFNQNNSTLYNIDPNGFPSTRVTAMTENRNGELVLANVESPTPINFYSPVTGWRTLPFSASNLDRIDDLLTDNGNNIWCRIINFTGGLIVFNEEENRIISLNSAEGNGNLPNNSVNTFALDKEGDVWVGTNDGIAVFFNPERIFSGGNVDASTPIFESRPLLREEIITAIEIDPANRKWVGTNNGIWLFEPDGTEVVANFTTENSPLISNRIVDIEVDEESGEVFFATNNGIISYRGAATESFNPCEEISVFPNPVRPGYQGQLSVYNIPDNSIVKIVDSGGKLFYEGRGTGNSFSWDLRNYNGEEAKSGVYFILNSSQDGEEGCTTKFAIVK